MKNVIIALLLALTCCTVQAQLIKEKAPIESKYLAGAVPVVDGKVTFSRELQTQAPLSKKEAYKALSSWIAMYFNNADVLRRTNIGSNADEGHIEIGIVQYITFRSSTFVLDRTQIIYHLSIDINQSKVNVKMDEISYFYEEERAPTKYTAEEWITDEVSLNRKKNGFNRFQGKFRIKTIDLFDNLCNEISSALL